MSTPTIMRSQTARAVDNAVISGIGVVAEGDSAIDLAARAGHAALADAGIDGDAVDVLIHVGVYRDDNIVEPAVAALIQKRMGIGLDYSRGDHRMYSFDLMNGACGVPVALSVGAGLLATGASTVLITAADVHPGAGSDSARGFPYEPTGAAILLANLPDSDHGVGRLCGAASSGEGEPVGYAHIPGVGADGRRTITVEPTPVEGLRPLVADVLARVDILPQVAAALPEDIEIAGATDVFRPGRPVHTAGPILALSRSRAAGATQLTLVAAGGGPEATAVNIAMVPR